MKAVTTGAVPGAQFFQGLKGTFQPSVAISSVTYLTDAQTVSKPGGPLHILHM